MITDDGRDLHLWVDYRQSQVIREKGMPNLYGAEEVETYVFGAASVAALEKRAAT
jgi:hypothetical protein